MSDTTIYCTADWSQSGAPELLTNIFWPFGKLFFKVAQLLNSSPKKFQPTGSWGKWPKDGL